MSHFIDQKALEIAQRFAEEHGVTDVQTIARYQLVAIETLKEAYAPYAILETVDFDNSTTVKSLTGLVFDSALPKDQWFPVTDDHNVAGTLARQRRWIADAIKDAIRTKRFSVNPDKKLNTQLATALKAARGWVLNAIDSSTAQQDLKLIDDALDASGIDIPCTCLSDLEEDAYDYGGPMRGRRRPPPCRAKVHSR